MISTPQWEQRFGSSKLVNLGKAFSLISEAHRKRSYLPGLICPWVYNSRVNATAEPTGLRSTSSAWKISRGAIIVKVHRQQKNQQDQNIETARWRSKIRIAQIFNICGGYREYLKRQRRTCETSQGESSGAVRLVAALGQDTIDFILPIFSWCQDHEVTRTSMDEPRQAPRNIDT